MKIVNIYTNVEWSAEVTEGGSWLNINPREDKIYVSAGANFEEEERIGTITVSSPNEDVPDVEITVKQGCVDSDAVIQLTTVVNAWYWGDALNTGNGIFVVDLRSEPDADGDMLCTRLVGTVDLTSGDDFGIAEGAYNYVSGEKAGLYKNTFTGTNDISEYGNIGRSIYYLVNGVGSWVDVGVFNGGAFTVTKSGDDYTIRTNMSYLGYYGDMGDDFCVEYTGPIQFTSMPAVIECEFDIVLEIDKTVEAEYDKYYINLQSGEDYPAENVVLVITAPSSEDEYPTPGTYIVRDGTAPFTVMPGYLDGRYIYDSFYGQRTSDSGGFTIYAFPNNGKVIMERDENNIYDITILFGGKVRSGFKRSLKGTFHGRLEMPAPPAPQPAPALAPALTSENSFGLNNNLEAMSPTLVPGSGKTLESFMNR